MTTALNEFQFELLPSMEADSGFVFGIGANLSVDGEGFDPGNNEWETQDTRNSRRGTAAFGRDTQIAKTWLWGSHIDRDDVDEAVATLEEAQAAWWPDDAEIPGWQTSLRYKIAGRTRRIFGRPRRFAAPPTNRILGGYVPVTHDFSLVDAHTYDDIESMVSIAYVSPTEGETGGLTFPTTFPIVTAPRIGAGSAQIDIGGNARCYPVIRLRGPWTNPRFVTESWSLDWTGSIGAGDWVEFDLRPWALTVLDQDGASQVGGLSPKTHFEECYFPAGSRPQIDLEGVATSGNARAEIRWRNTWKSI